jgi:hypothetical protein
MTRQRIAGDHWFQCQYPGTEPLLQQFKAWYTWQAAGLLQEVHSRMLMKLFHIETEVQ